ncbi:hypothetical protein GQX73_g10605 [Xylaria multiplex]|uniref:Uncharacterized protein n=1 Tax=Xylaria multiplex TaxID=323545 RepID=A0A7C8MF66_9PEZI|nr:hypothetical protein GQX73_g10605 [Xylaria multiplex]
MSSPCEKERRSTVSLTVPSNVPSNVPKFSSFKLKPTNVIQHGAETVTDESRHTDHHSHPHISTGIDAVLKSTSHLSRTLKRLGEPELDENASYRLDKRGDRLITQYGSNDRSHIPVYNRIGHGRVLGINGFVKVEKLGGREEFFIRNAYESAPLLSSDRKNLLARGIRPHSRFIRVRPRKSNHTATQDYLSFNSSRKRKRDGDTSEEDSSQEGLSYRSIHGKSEEQGHSDSGEEYDSDVSGDVLNKSMDPMAMRSIELSRKVHQCPEDVESWLELVEHQDSLLNLQTGARAPTTAEVKSFANIKLSLLEKALTHICDDDYRERLNLKVIAEGLKVWEFKVTLKRFAEIMQEYPKSFELWKLYINFLQTTISACRYDGIKQLYTDKLQSLGNELLGLSTVPKKIECSKQILYVFLRLTRFLADAGYVELASAAWQASLELNLARPSTLSSMGWKIPSSFQEYWESEHARLGEEGWQGGWATYVNDVTAQKPPNPNASKLLVPPTTRDGYKAWVAVEHDRAQNATMPARTLDEGSEEDPFRVVIFTDLRNILLYFPADIVPHIQSKLLDAFLIFCGLPPCFQDGSLIEEVARDPFLVRSARDVPFACLMPRNNKDWSEDPQKKSPEFFYEVQRVSLTTELLFPFGQWFKYFERVREKLPFESYRWIATTLKQLVRVVGIGGLGSYTLAFESTNEPGNEKKTAKTLLKQDPLNVDLYLGYSNLECERKNKAAARAVLSAAFSLPSMLGHARSRLGVQAAWLELDNGDCAKAVFHLCRSIEDVPNSGNAQLPEPTEATPSQILKARLFLTTNRDYKISSGDISQAIVYAEGLVLLEYLSKQNEKELMSQKQGDIWSAIVRITQCSEGLVSHGHQHSLYHERFLQSSARLLYYHATHGPFRSGLLREQLIRYLSYFPSNTIFLSLFAWREERLSINDRVRSLLQDHVLTRTNDCLSSHVFAIDYELRTGNTHSARGAFERSLSSEVCMHHVGLWIAYIRFCHSRGELRAKSKAVFYRAIQACPWSKNVLLEAFSTLVREMDSAELNSVYATMCEKGLRIHVDMDEFVENWRHEQKRTEREKGTCLGAKEFLVRPTSLAEVREIVLAAGQLVLKQKGVIRGLQNWGEFSLPKAISVHQMRHTTGYYFAMRFDASVSTQEDVRKMLRLDPRMIRHSSVKLGDGKLGTMSRLGGVDWSNPGVE